MLDITFFAIALAIAFSAGLIIPVLLGSLMYWWQYIKYRTMVQAYAQLQHNYVEVLTVKFFVGDKDKIKDKDDDEDDDEDSDLI